MTTTFFRKYPKIEYLIDEDGSTTLLTDISRAVAVNSLVVPDDISAYTYYEIQDGDRPDIISHKLYGDVQYYWTFFILNDFLKDGYMDSWPLSTHEFSKMIDREYSKYSAISLMPPDEYNPLNGNNRIDFAIIPLDDEYLPYLRLSLIDNSAWAKILKYDHALHQCIVYDISNPTTGASVSRESFVKYNTIKNNFKISWDDTVQIALLPDDTQETMIQRNIDTKIKWINEVYDTLKQYDSSGVFAVEDTKYNENLSDDELKNSKLIVKISFILNKTLVGAHNFFRWNSYQDAPYQYTLNSKIVSGYDVLSNPDTIFHEYTSNIEYETDLNDSKKKIKVIRPDYIRQFSDEYYEILNS
jgi:hypothetical protein